VFRPSNKEALFNDQSDDSMKTESTFCGLLIKGDNLNSDLSVCFTHINPNMVTHRCVGNDPVSFRGSIVTRMYSDLLRSLTGLLKPKPSP